MKVVKTFRTKSSRTLIAELENGYYAAQRDTFTFFICKKVDVDGQIGFKIISEPLVGGTMMRDSEEFEKCVEWLDEKRFNEAIEDYEG